MRERIPYLDALRCLAIFLVVLLHNDAPVVVNTACYGRPSWYLCMFLDGAVRLGVPLFFMISGCLLLNGTGAAEPAAFYRKKLPRLLAPLAVWNVIYHWTNAWQFHTDTGLLALLQKAFNRGTGYHMWYIYVLLGLYLLCPFLKRMVDGCTPRQLAALAGIILLPTAVLPLVSQMVSWSVVPLDTLMPGQAAYFLLGYGLGRWSLSGQQRVFLYLGGAAGYLVCTAVNLLSASPQEIPLPLSGGNTIFHYLTACALFVWVRTLWEKRKEVLRPLARPLAWLSQRAFGIYWVHPLVLDLVTRQVGGGLTVLEYLAVRLGLTFGISLAFSQTVSCIPVLKKLLL